MQVSCCSQPVCSCLSAALTQEPATCRAWKAAYDEQQLVDDACSKPRRSDCCLACVGYTDHSTPTRQAVHRSALPPSPQEQAPAPANSSVAGKCNTAPLKGEHAWLASCASVR